MEMLNAFDQALRNLSATTSEPTGKCELRFFPTPTKGARRFVPRQLNLIRPSLLGVLRGLIEGRERWPLYLWSSSPGTGKTSAALSILDHCGLGWDKPVVDSEDCHDVLCGFIDIVSFPRVLRQVERKQVRMMDSGNLLTEPELWNQINNRKVLVIDDIRKPTAKEASLGDDSYTAMKRMLDSRVGRPLIVTGNLNPGDELQQVWDDRLADRILCGTVVEVDGESRRWQ